MLLQRCRPRLSAPFPSCNGSNSTVSSLRARNSPTRDLPLFRFSEAAGACDEFDAVVRAFAVHVPVLLQLIERAGLVACLGAPHPFGIAVIDHLALRGALADHDYGLVLLDHVNRACDLSFLGFLVCGAS